MILHFVSATHAWHSEDPVAQKQFVWELYGHRVRYIGIQYIDGRPQGEMAQIVGSSMQEAIGCHSIHPPTSSGDLPHTSALGTKEDKWGEMRTITHTLTP